MPSSVVVELIKLAGTVVWAGVALAVVVAFRPGIRDQILPRLTRLKAFGVEVEIAEVVKKRLDEAAAAAPAGPEASRTQTARRAARLVQVLRGGRVLLVNDRPAEMTAVVSIFESLGMIVDVVTSTEAALDRLDTGSYDVVVSDMVRDGDDRAGLRLLEQARAAGHRHPVIFTVGRYDPSLGVPAYAFGITSRVDELINLVCDALERVRG